MKLSFSLILLSFVVLVVQLNAAQSKPIPGIHGKPVWTDPIVDGMPGEPVPIDPLNPRVIASLNYALAVGYPLQNHVSASIVSATEQVVNGLFYEMIVAVQFPEVCVMVMMNVWHRASPPGWFLTHHQLLNTACPPVVPPAPPPNPKPDPKPNPKPDPKPDPEPEPFSMSYSYMRLRN